MTEVGGEITAELLGWMPAFLHFYPGLTPDSYRELSVTDWELMRQYIEAANKRA